MLLLILVTLALEDVCERFSDLVTTNSFAGLSLLSVTEASLDGEKLMNDLHARDLVGVREVVNAISMPLHSIDWRMLGTVGREAWIFCSNRWS